MIERHCCRGSTHIYTDTHRHKSSNQPTAVGGEQNCVYLFLFCVLPERRQVLKKLQYAAFPSRWNWSLCCIKSPRLSPRRYQSVSEAALKQETLHKQGSQRKVLNQSQNDSILGSVFKTDVVRTLPPTDRW